MDQIADLEQTFAQLKERRLVLNGLLTTLLSQLSPTSFNSTRLHTQAPTRSISPANHQQRSQSPIGGKFPPVDSHQPLQSGPAPPTLPPGQPIAQAHVPPTLGPPSPLASTRPLAPKPPTSTGPSPPTTTPTIRESTTRRCSVHTQVATGRLTLTLQAELCQQLEQQTEGLHGRLAHELRRMDGQRAVRGVFEGLSGGLTVLHTSALEDCATGCRVGCRSGQMGVFAAPGGGEIKEIRGTGTPGNGGNGVGVVQVCQCGGRAADGFEKIRKYLIEIEVGAKQTGLEKGRFDLEKGLALQERGGIIGIYDEKYKSRLCIIEGEIDPPGHHVKFGDISYSVLAAKELTCFRDRLVE